MICPITNHHSLQFDVFLAVLDVYAAEGGGDFGAEVATLNSEDPRVIFNFQFLVYYLHPSWYTLFPPLYYICIIHYIYVYFSG